MTEEQTEVLDEKDRQNGVAAHQRGLVSHDKDRAWRWSSAEERMDVLPVKRNVSMEETEPSSKQL